MKDDTKNSKHLVCFSRNSSLENIFECFIPEPEEWVLVAAYVKTFVVGVLGNILKQRYANSYIFMVNLAVADLNVILVLLPSSLLVDVTETWLLGGAMCKISIALGTMCIAVSKLTLCAISIERWYAICRPLSFHSIVHKARITIVAIWLISICIFAQCIYRIEHVQRSTFVCLAVKMLVVIVAGFAMCFLPNHALNILRYLEQLKKVPNLRMFALIAHWCTFFNSCINPIIYNFMS
ncbi:OX2R-like protein, partial [Mya arenaria]